MSGMPAGRLLRAAVLTLIAPAGVLVGHALAYLLAIPDPADRAAVLASSGHQWWTLGTVVGPVLAAAGIVVLMVAILRRPPDSGRFRRELGRWMMPRMAACQLGLFFIIETVERAASGDAYGGNLYHEIIEHGVLAQALVAVLITGLCWCLALAVDRACFAIARLPVPSLVGLPATTRSRLHPPGIRLRQLNARAPPILAF